MPGPHSLAGADVARIRQHHGWSQQLLANRSQVNKAYISEYETGLRTELPPEMMERLWKTLLDPPAGRTRAEIVVRDGRSRLRLIDKDGNIEEPDIASIQWTEADGTTYSMFLGKVD